MLGFEYAVYDQAVCHLQSGKERDAEALMRRPGLKYHQRKSELVCRDLGERPRILAKFVRLTRHLPGRDRAGGADFLYSRLVEACGDDVGALEEARSMMGEEERGQLRAAHQALVDSLKKAGVDIDKQDGIDSNKM